MKDQEDMVKSKFAKKLENNSYLCMACKIKLPDTIAAVKHFNNGGNEQHRQTVEALREKLSSVV